MTTSLVKFFDKTAAPDGKKLFWSRAPLDGVPFRGAHAPMFTEDEYETRVVRVADPKNDFFDVTVAAQNRAYLEVLDAVANGWFKLIYIERFWNQTTKHYVEWVEYYMEDGTRVPFSPPGVMELSHGQGSLPFYPPTGA